MNDIEKQKYQDLFKDCVPDLINGPDIPFSIQRMIAYYRRPEEKGFTKRASDVVRIEFFSLYDGDYWCFYGQWNLEKLKESNSEPQVALACEMKWTLLGVEK